MARHKLRVLLDLSMAGRGYCGIAQDVRLLYKTLALSNDVDVTGFIYQPRKLAAVHKFVRPGATTADRIDNQARFLWAMANGEDFVAPNFRPLRILMKLRRLAEVFGARRAHLDPLEVQTFWQVVWRQLFSQTLAPQDIELVRSGNFLLSNLSDGMIYARALFNRRPIRIDTSGYDFLIVQGPRAFRVSPSTRQIVRYHDMIPMREPDTMATPLVISAHHKAIMQCQSSHFVCNSEPTRTQLTGVYPQLRDASVTIPYTMSDVYSPDPHRERILSIIDVRRSSACEVTSRRVRKIPRYIMSVSTLEPRKNFIGLIQAYNDARSRSSVERMVPNLKLVIVGSPGWKYEPTLAAMRPFVERGDLIHLERVTSDELRVLYSHAEAFVFPSHAEGFGFPPLEAMQCDTPAIVSDVPEHRWVMGDAALYCDSYDSRSIADAIERLLAADDSHLVRADLVARGRRQVEKYSLEHCSTQWVDLLHRLHQENTTAGAAPTIRPHNLGETDRGLMDRAA